jgi:hypothetical protein
LQEIKTLLNVDNDSTTSVIFRNKRKGWHKKYITITSAKKQYNKKYVRDNFGVFFELGNCNMPTCYECPYRDKSVADIRLGDYWGEKYNKNKKGVSMVLAMTEQGLALLKKLDNLCIKEEQIKDYFTIQYPYNQQKPIYYTELMLNLREDTKLKLLRKKYCKKYEIQASLGRMYLKVNRLVGDFFRKE